jgi:pimeloyl-ACP methyl ester carboxylesterase
MRDYLFTPIFFIIAALFCTAQEAVQITKYGSGNPVILLSGFATNHEVFDQTIEHLKSQHEIHAVDYAGFGKVEPIDFPWLPQIQQQLLDHIAGIESDRIILIGHSMGGTLALWLAAQPELKISNVIVIDGLPASGALMFPDYDPDKIVYDSPYSKQQLAMDDEQFLVMATMMASGMVTSEKDKKTVINRIIKSDRETYLKGYIDYLKLDVRPYLKKITSPVHIIAAAGMYGEAMARKTYSDQFSNLADYTIEIHPTAKHFIMLDATDWYLEQLSSHL